MSQRKKGEQTTQQPHIARDQLQGAFAGSENHGLHKDEGSKHSTNVKSRQLGKENKRKQPVH